MDPNPCCASTNLLLVLSRLSPIEDVTPHYVAFQQTGRLKFAAPDWAWRRKTRFAVQFRSGTCTFSFHFRIRELRAQALIRITTAVHTRVRGFRARFHPNNARFHFDKEKQETNCERDY